MAIREIRKYQDPILRQEAKPITQITKEINNLIQDLKDTLIDSKGIGLAANQIGISLQAIIVSQENKGTKNFLVLLNPKIIAHRGKQVIEEGCLSFPGIYFKIRRAYWIRLTGLNVKGEPLILEAEGIFAQVIQHEIDHLRGKVFIDHLPFWKRWKIKRELARIMKEKVNSGE